MEWVEASGVKVRRTFLAEQQRDGVRATDRYLLQCGPPKYWYRAFSVLYRVQARCCWEDACGLVLVPGYGGEGDSTTSGQRAREVPGTCARSWAALALPGAVRCSQPGGPCGWTHGRGSQ